MEEEIKPKRIKDERFLLLSALNQVENIIKLTEEMNTNSSFTCTSIQFIMNYNDS